MRVKDRATSAILLIAAVAAISVWWFWDDLTPSAPQAPEGVYCTADAMQCPDGSYVGRVPPNCEFAQCPAGTSTQRVYLETRLDQGASGLGVRIVPHVVLEDSRCPVDVVCVWAGTIRVRATLESGLGSGIQVFELGKPVTTEGEIVELVAVAPSARQGVIIPVREYLFTFKVTKRTFGTAGKG